MSKSLLCDGHNLAFRAFYGIRELSRSDGFPTNMVHGWLRSFWRLEDDWKPDEIWIFFDKGGSRRREEILPSYKANRGLPPEGFPSNWSGSSVCPRRLVTDASSVRAWRPTISLPRPSGKGPKRVWIRSS